MENQDIYKILAVLWFGMVESYLCWFHHIVPHRHVGIPHRFSKIMSEVPYSPNIYFKLPIDTVTNMFTGPDRDTVKYTCDTNDGVKFEGEVVVTNTLQIANATAAFRVHGVSPDITNIYDMVVFYMQEICANMTSRQFFVEFFNDIDDTLYPLLVHAQDVFQSGLKIEEGKVKCLKPRALNSNIAELIKQEAEHKQEILTAIEQKRADEQRALNQMATHRAELEREAATHQAALHREADSAAAAANNTIILARAQQKAASLLAEGNVHLLTSEYLQLQHSRAIANNTKVYVGESIDNLFLLGS